MDGSIIYFVVLPTAIVSPIVAEYILDAILGSAILMGGHTGIWQFLENLPDFIFYIVLPIFGFAAVFVGMVYVVLPALLLLGIFLMICSQFLNNEHTCKLAQKVLLTSYQMNVVLLLLILIAFYAALNFYLLH